LRLLKVYC